MSEKRQQQLDEFITRRGLRRTPQRQKIIDAIFVSDEHFTAEELYERVRKSDSKISRATVYRSLTLFVEAGLLREIDLGGDRTHYDPNFDDKPGHGHIICVDCGKVIEFSDEELSQMEDGIVLKHGFKPLRSTLRIEAKCDALRKSGMCPDLIKARMAKKLPIRS